MVKADSNGGNGGGTVRVTAADDHQKAIQAARAILDKQLPMGAEYVIVVEDNKFVRDRMTSYSSNVIRVRVLQILQSVVNKIDS